MQDFARNGIENNMFDIRHLLFTMKTSRPKVTLRKSEVLDFMSPILRVRNDSNLSKRRWSDGVDRRKNYGGEIMAIIAIFTGKGLLKTCMKGCGKKSDGRPTSTVGG